MNNDQKELLEYWYAYIYEQEEDQTPFAQYLVRHLGQQPLRIMEAACGSGKCCIPLVQAGHQVTGIDQSEHMLARLQEKAEQLPDLHIQQADLLAKPWGTGYDAVILGSNLLLNIVTDRDYKHAQKNLLERAHEALKTNGRLLIDYDCPLALSAWTPANTEWVCFDGTDDRGTYGKYIVVNGSTNDRTRVVTGSRRWEMRPADGAAFVHTENSYKYFPTLEQVCTWLYRVGFTVESIHGGYHGEPFDVHHRRAVIWARKVDL